VHVALKLLRGHALLKDFRLRWSQIEDERVFLKVTWLHGCFLDVLPRCCASDDRIILEHLNLLLRFLRSHSISLNLLQSRAVNKLVVSLFIEEMRSVNKVLLVGLGISRSLHA